MRRVQKSILETEGHANVNDRDRSTQPGKMQNEWKVLGEKGLQVFRVVVMGLLESQKGAKAGSEVSEKESWKVKAINPDEGFVFHPT